VTGSTPDTGFNLSLVFALEALTFFAIGLIALAKAKELKK
jgi:hypothetical protein